MFAVPDWKDASCYPQPGGASNARFAWEFLRRNPRYQAAWVEYATVLKRIADSEPELATYAEFLAADPQSEDAARERIGGPEEQARLAGAVHDHALFTVESRVDTNEGHRVTLTPLHGHLGSQWGLQQIVHPAEQYGVRVRFIERKSVTQIPQLGGMRRDDRVDSFMSGPHLLLKIDLRWPFEVIKETVLPFIRWTQERRAGKGEFELVRNRALAPKRYIEYLRVLDARTANVPYDRIGEVLCPHESNDPPDYGRTKRLKAAHREASRLRDEGYRVLPLLKDNLSNKRKEK